MVTGEDVKLAMTGADIKRVAHHTCSLCGYETAYIRHGDDLYFDPGCYCTAGGYRPVTFEQAAEFINIQSNPDVQADLMRRFGFK